MNSAARDPSGAPAGPDAAAVATHPAVAAGGWRPLNDGRDLVGYAGRPPDPRWPGGARVAVSFVLNFEEGAELAVAEGDAHNEAVYEVVDRLDGVADRCLQSHFDYGTRAGWWRIADIFDRFDARCTVSACGLAVRRSPALARDAVQRGHEVSGHGWRWHSPVRLTPDQEREAIARTVAAITEATGGIRPVGWHSRSSASAHTRRLLIEEGGFVYDSDDYGDDLPHCTGDPRRPHVVLPYAFDTNDMQFQHSHRFGRADDFAGYVTDAFDWLWREGATQPKMMSIGLHLRMIGRPARIGALERILQHLHAQGGVWIARRDEIARHWLATQREAQSPAWPAAPPPASPAAPSG